MSKREIRETVRAVMAELDRRAKGVGRGVRKVVLPAAMGTALALGGCGSDRVVGSPDGAYMGPPPRDQRAELLPADGAVYMGPDAGPDLASVDAAYMAPDARVDVGAGADGILYGAPEASVDPEPGLLYMAPGPDGGAR